MTSLENFEFPMMMLLGNLEFSSFGGDAIDFMRAAFSSLRPLSFFDSGIGLMSIELRRSLPLSGERVRFPTEGKRAPKIFS